MSGRTCNWILAGAGLVLLAAVSLFPAIDLAAARAFHVPGQGFPWRTAGVGLFVRHHAPEVLLSSLVVCVVLWRVGVRRGQPILGLTGGKIGYLFATLIVGPGLIVESILKPYSGRARPQDLVHFGGGADYTAPLSFADACTTNCSFVSGHAAVAFWLTAYAFIAPPAHRLPVLLLGLVVGVAMGAVRVMQGAHFVSDVVYAAAIVVIVNMLLARILLRDGKRQGPPPLVPGK
jgi:lipid A 4'-phosphatase